MTDRELQSTVGPEATESVAPDDFTRLLEKEFRANTDERKARIGEAVRTLATQALENAKIVGDDVYDTVDAMKAEIDAALSKQINEIIHHPEFQKLESAWRGLLYLVGNTSTGRDLKIRVLNVTKDELGRMFRAYANKAWDQSPLFKKVYQEEFGQLGGQPYGAFICDYYFDHRGPDIAILKGLSQIGAAAHAPFISAAGPTLLDMESWQELPLKTDLAKIFDATAYRAWNSLRAAEDSRYLALTLPRFLGRNLYGANAEPVEDFAFEEDTAGGAHENYLWLNAAYGLGLRITESFKEDGWCTRIRGVTSGGTLEDLPTALFPTDDGSMDAKCPTEIGISDTRENELSSLGLIGLIHRKNTDKATFVGAQTLQRPKEYQGRDADFANSNANISARLPYVFATCRFAHYLKCMVRDWIGETREAPQLSARLQSWIKEYVDVQSETSDDHVKARKPLKDARVEVVPDEANPGYYKGNFFLVPHYQLEGMDIALSMVSRLPKSSA